VLAPYSAHPKTIHLIKGAKIIWFSKFLIFSNNKKTVSNKKQEKYFFTFQPDKYVPLSKVFPFIMKNQGSHNS